MLFEFNGAGSRLQMNLFMAKFCYAFSFSQHENAQGLLSSPSLVSALSAFSPAPGKSCPVVSAFADLCRFYHHFIANVIIRCYNINFIRVMQKPNHGVMNIRPLKLALDRYYEDLFTVNE